MSTRYQRKIEEYSRQLQEGEEVVEVAFFNAIPTIACFFGFAIASFVLGRIFQQYMFVMLFTNVLSMWMMVDAAHALYLTQNSCIIVTDQRTFGQVGEKKVNLLHSQLKKIVLNRILFLDGGDERSFVAIRYVSNQKELYQAICNQCPNLQNSI